jgi:M6 family metalloprotease-like protein
MNQSVIKACVLISFLIFCLPMVSASGDSAGSSEAFASKEVPDFSSCEIINGSTLKPYCPIWDGDHAKPDPFLVYEVQKKIVAASLKSQGLSTQQVDFGVSSLQPPPVWRGMPTKGTVRIPVFLVDFPDAPHDPSQTVADVQSKMFGDGNSVDYPYESLKNYYQRSSYNQLTITGDVYGWYTAAQPRSYYLSLGKPQGRVVLMNEILQKYDNEVNFADYDADRNGKMDALFIKWAGSDNGWANFWWACMSTVSSPITVDGVTPYKYVWSWYSNPNGGVYDPQVDIHENGHLLGLPDYYDYDDNLGPKGGVGGWDMMDYNWGDHNAFSKYLLGWIDPIVISSGTHQIILPPSGTSSSSNAVMIMPGAVTDSFGEFFLVQYREKGNGNDPLSGGPGNAVWIWHVDSTLSGGDFLYDNSYTTHKLLRLMEADGKEHLEAGNGYWDINDFYVPGKGLGPGTVPDSRNYTGSITNVSVTNIQQLPSSMQMVFSIPSSGPSATFNGTPLSGTAPLGVTFTDTSTGTSILNRRWDFGDGNISNYAANTNPFHNYTSAGNYSVNLTITNASGTNSFLRTKYITVTAPPIAPGANFTADITIGTAPLAVKFTDTSAGTGISAWTWDFNNDTVIDSTSRNPAFIYASPGIYSVNLTVIGTGGSDSEVKVNYINVRDANLTTNIGIYQNGNWYLDYNGNGAWDTGDKQYGFGTTGWTPVEGKWTADSISKIGIYYAGNWYLDYNGDGQFIPASGDKYLPYGAPGWTHLVGDWNGDGTSEIGICKDGIWYLDYNGSGTINANTKYFSFGGAGWTPIVGDWNGDKKDEIGIYQNGNWYLDYDGNGFWSSGDKYYGFGTMGWTPVTGKWTSDGFTKIGIYKDGNWYIDYNGDGLFSGIDRYIPYGVAGWTHLVGDWNGDGTSEIGIYKDGIWYLDYDGSGTINANTKYYSFGGVGWTSVVGKWR